MQFDILTIFPNIFDSYINESILKRGQAAGLLNIRVHDIRGYTKDKHRTTDDTPYGGGAGMVMKVEPIYEAVTNNTIGKNTTTRSGFKHGKSTRIVLLSAKGEQFTQAKAEELAKYKQVMLICGRYEGVDERVADYIADEEISVGPYVLTGGELPALTIVDAVSRLVPGVLGNVESLREESFSMNKEAPLRQPADRDAQRADQIENLERVGEYPHYTRPEVFLPKKGARPVRGREGTQRASASNGVNWKVPEVLLGGNHAEIEKWRKERSR